MKQYTPEKLVAISRYKVLFPTLSPEIQRDVYSRMRVLIEEEKPSVENSASFSPSES